MATTIYTSLVFTCAMFLSLNTAISTKHVKITVLFAFTLLLIVQKIIHSNKTAFKNEFPLWEAVVLYLVHYVLFFMPVFHILADKYISTK